MTGFVIGKPVRTREPKVVVDAGLPAGRHRFRLVVTRDDGRRSAPMEQVVVIRNTLRPINPSPIDRDVVIRRDPVPRPRRPRRPPVPRRPDPED